MDKGQRSKLWHSDFFLIQVAQEAFRSLMVFSFTDTSQNSLDETLQTEIKILSKNTFNYTFKPLEKVRNDSTWCDAIFLYQTFTKGSVKTQCVSMLTTE